MTPLFKKLNFKQQQEIVVINHPESFNAELNEMMKETTIISSLDKAEDIEFVLGFVINQYEVNEFTKKIVSKLKGDAIVWLCYPKLSSKKYKCDFNRDTGWAILGENNLESVRMVAVDEDWSALRFRKVEFMKTITRRESYALTTEAKARTSQKGI
jgi:hypothetical protein